jgi:FHIPEP family protein
MTASPRLAVELEVRGRLAAALVEGTGTQGDAGAAVEAALTDLMRALGVPGRPEVSVSMDSATAPPEQWATLRVNGMLCRYSMELLADVAESVEGAHADAQAAAAIERWIAAGAAADAARLLGVLAAEAVKLQPSVLFGADQLEVYAHSLDLPTAADAAWLETVLVPLVDLRISLAEGEGIARILAEAAGSTPAVAREQLIAESAADTIELRVPESYQATLTTPIADGESQLALVRRGLFEELGVVLPPFTFGAASCDLSVRINDLFTLPRVALGDRDIFVNGTVDELRDSLGVTARPARNPATGLQASFADAGTRPGLEASGYTCWEATEYFVLVLADAIRRNARCFVQRESVEAQLERLAAAFPTLVRTARRRVELSELTAALRSLVADQISIRDLGPVLERVVDVAYDETFTDDLVAFLRTGLRRQITDKRARSTGTVVVYLLDDTIEQTLRTAAGTQAPEIEQVVGALRAELEFLPPMAQSPHVLAWDDVCTPLRAALAAPFPRLYVLGYADLSPEVNIQPVARLSFS